MFSPTTISLTPRFCQKRKVWLCFFAENAENDPKTHSYEDNAKFNSAFLATTLSYALRFRQKRGMIEHFEYLGEFVEVFQKCWLYCVLYILVIKRCKKKVFEQTMKISCMCTFKRSQREKKCRLHRMTPQNLFWPFDVAYIMKTHEWCHTTLSTFKQGTNPQRGHQMFPAPFNLLKLQALTSK